MTTAKNKVFIGLELENCYLVGRDGGGGGVSGCVNKNLLVGESTGGIFPGGRNEQGFGWRGKDSPYPLQ